MTDFELLKITLKIDVLLDLRFKFPDELDFLQAVLLDEVAHGQEPWLADAEPEVFRFSFALMAVFGYLGFFTISILSFWSSIAILATILLLFHFVLTAVFATLLWCIVAPTDIEIVVLVDVARYSSRTKHVLAILVPDKQCIDTVPVRLLVHVKRKLLINSIEVTLQLRSQLHGHQLHIKDANQLGLCMLKLIVQERDLLALVRVDIVAPKLVHVEYLAKLVRQRYLVLVSQQMNDGAIFKILVAHLMRGALEVVLGLREQDFLLSLLRLVIALQFFVFLEQTGILLLQPLIVGIQIYQGVFHFDQLNLHHV